MYSPTKIRINIESPSHFRKKKQKLNEKQTLLNKKASPTLTSMLEWGMLIQDTIFHCRLFTSSFTEKFKPIFTTFLPLILKASA